MECGRWRERAEIAEKFLLVTLESGLPRRYKYVHVHTCIGHVYMLFLPFPLRDSRGTYGWSP